MREEELTASTARTLWLLPILLLAALGCDRGPDVDTLHTEIQRRLDARFEDGLFELATFERRGSAPFHDLEKDLSGLFVYYDAELEFLHERVVSVDKDEDGGAWLLLGLSQRAFRMNGR